jgi:subtilisin family serine protease
MLTLIASLLVAGYASSAELKKAPQGKAVPSQYIIRLNSELFAKDVSNHAMKLIKGGSKDTSRAQVIYSDLNPNFLGYSAKLSPMALEILLRDNLVSYVEEDQVLDINACIQQLDADWGLRRVSNSDFDPTNFLNYEYNEDSGGKNVDVYILDTGIYCDHNDFTSKKSGTCSFGKSYVVDLEGQYFCFFFLRLLNSIYPQAIWI